VWKSFENHESAQTFGKREGKNVSAEQMEKAMVVQVCEKGSGRSAAGCVGPE
jgi:hypothetical protein